MNDEALRELATQQARTNALLEALTHEVREGFDRGHGKFEKFEERVTGLEHERTRARLLVRVTMGVAGSAGLLAAYDRIMEFLK